MKIKLEFKLQDFWVGVFWRVSGEKDSNMSVGYKQIDIWICLLPCLPIHITNIRYSIN